MQRVAIYPGTFDPITKGHLDIILRSAELVDELIVAVAFDVIKTQMFSLEERVDMVRNEVASVLDQLPAASKVSAASKVRVVGFRGLLINFAHECGARLIVRGLRAVSDFEYEFQLFWANCKLDSTIETIFLPAKDATQFLSATVVKEIARLGGDVSEFVSPYVRAKLAEKFGGAS